MGVEGIHTFPPTPESQTHETQKGKLSPLLKHPWLP